MLHAVDREAVTGMGAIVHITEKDKITMRGFAGGAVVENMPTNAGDTGSSPGLGRSHVPRNSWAHEPQLLSLRI